MTPPPLGHVHPEWADFGALEWVLVAVAAAGVVWTIYKTVRYTIVPGEAEPDHVKRLIFEPPDGPERGVSSMSSDDS